MRCSGSRLPLGRPADARSRLRLGHPAVADVRRQNCRKFGNRSKKLSSFDKRLSDRLVGDLGDLSRIALGRYPMGSGSDASSWIRLHRPIPCVAGKGAPARHVDGARPLSRSGLQEQVAGVEVMDELGARGFGGRGMSHLVGGTLPPSTPAGYPNNVAALEHDRAWAHPSITSGGPGFAQGPRASEHVHPLARSVLSILTSRRPNCLRHLRPCDLRQGELASSLTNRMPRGELGAGGVGLHHSELDMSARPTASMASSLRNSCGRRGSLPKTS